VNAKSIKGKSTEEIKSSLEKTIKEDFKPTLAICFVSKKLDRVAITNVLDAAGISVFGCTTSGEFTSEVTEKGSAAILLLDMNREDFQIYFHEFTELNFREVAKEIALNSKEKFSNPAFLIGLSHYATDGEEILHGLTEVAGKDINVFGGGAGDDYEFTDNYVFTNNKDAGQAIVCIALNENKIEIKGIATCGWKAVGTIRTVTKSEGNHVFMECYWSKAYNCQMKEYKIFSCTFNARQNIF